MRKICILIWMTIILVVVPTAVRAEATDMPENPPKTLSLKVMTLNLHSGINWYGRFDLDSIVQFIQTVNPDIIGLQEVDKGWSSATLFTDIPNELASRLHMYYAFCICLERNGGYFGNLILSKYPIVQNWAEQLPSKLEQRGFAMVQIQVDGVTVNFLTTHLGLSTEDRLAQMTGIMEFINQLSGPIILTGDFNDGINDPAVALARSRFLDIGERDGRGTFRMKNGAIASLRMDYILVSSGIEPIDYQIINNFISDHLPVIADIRIQVPTEEKQEGNI